MDDLLPSASFGDRSLRMPPALPLRSPPAAGDRSRRTVAAAMETSCYAADGLQVEAAIVLGGHVWGSDGPGGP